MYLNNSFHKALLTYINTACYSRVDFIISLVVKKPLFRKNSKKLYKLFSKTSKSRILNKQPTFIRVDFYDGRSRHVLNMINHLNQKLADDLVGAYLHGSLATGEEIRYSDFDGLVIIKNEVFKSKKRITRVGYQLNSLIKLMCQFDPLQHHGWFVLPEFALNSYSDSYFPTVLFEHSCSLLKDKGLELEIIKRDTSDFTTPFEQLSTGLIKQLNKEEIEYNSFKLKSLLSKFMLLPSFYYQSKNKEGIYKKYSFNLVKADFTDSEWEIMNTVSQIRADWDYSINPIQHLLLTSNNLLIRKLSRKMAPRISPVIAIRINQQLYSEMLELVLLMQEKLREQNEV